MSKSILVVGATGNYAQPVVWQLSKDGFDVRVFTRKREKAVKFFGEKFPIFEGNIEDDESLRKALAGCWGVHINMRGWWKDHSHDRLEHRGTANVVRLAKEAGVQRLTYLSDVHACETYSSLPHLKAKLDAEKAIRASGIPFAIFGCSFFMEGCHHLEKGDVIRVPVLRQPYHYVAANDYAAMVSQAYQAPEAPNTRIDVYGPEAIPAHQITEDFIAMVRPSTRIIPIPIWAATLYMYLIRHKNRQYSMRVVKMYRKHGEPGDPSQVDTSLGRPTTTFRQWCEAQRPSASAG
ncbi:MAG TPA: NmrA family NAD(P)-binding protein [Thermoanaerobaculia bacterium]|nr:NmrA family NAD(P)-binding protein [Thermoanaerobaculia bacterium]